jgi:hypothetical protein
MACSEHQDMSIDPTTLQAPDQSQWEAYDREFPPPVPAGRYLFKAPDTFTYEDHDGFMRVMVDPVTIQEAPEGKADTIRFTRCSAKPRTMGRLAGSSRLTDYLKACGIPPILSSDANDWVVAIDATAGAFFEAYVDWDAYDTETKESLANQYSEFEDDPENPGGKIPFIVEPTSGRTVQARARIRYFITPR